MATSKHLSELDDEIGFISHVVNGRSDSCDAIQEVDEEADLDLDGNSHIFFLQNGAFKIRCM